jgi:hypothetical protein
MVHRVKATLPGKKKFHKRKKHLRDEKLSADTGEERSFS